MLSGSSAVFAASVLGLGALGAAPREDPAALVGTWAWSYKDADGKTHRHVLEVEGSGDKVVARERYDDEEPVKVEDLKVVGKTVTFSVLRGKRSSTYNGTIKEKDLLDGQVSVTVEGQTNQYGWEAKREPAKKD